MPRPVPERFRGLLSVFALPSRTTRRRAVAVIALVLVLTVAIVYVTGGVQYATVHLVYIPILAAAFVFEIAGGLVAAFVAGLLLGPLMPLDTYAGDRQATINWVARVVAFCVVGAFVGAIAALLRRQMRQLQWLRDHDEDTGLLSLDGFLPAVERCIAGQGSGQPSLLVVVQLNNYLDMQNTFGPAFAASLLARICNRAREALPLGLPIALIQPDRIAALLPGEPEARDLRSSIERTLRQPYDVDGISVHVDVAVGWATFPDHAPAAAELLQKATIAMHAAARRGLPALQYHREDDRTSEENLLLLGLLPDAIRHDRLEMWHQAKVSLQTGEVVGSEALLRWRDPQRGLVPPASFIPQVEQSNLINDVTRWVVTAGIEDLADSKESGFRLTVALNASVRNLHDKSLVAALDEAVAVRNLDPATVDIEITEGAVMDDFDFCVDLIRRLRDRGYGVSIDDFGTGYSSLAYLKQLPVTTLKIDQAFIRDVANDHTDQSIVRAIVELSRALGLRCTAEGVEDEAAARLLREWGCDDAQGYLFHRPCPHEEFLSWIAHREVGNGDQSSGRP